MRVEKVATPVEGEQEMGLVIGRARYALILALAALGSGKDGSDLNLSEAVNQLHIAGRELGSVD